MAQMLRILSSHGFAQSSRLQKFLRFIVEETLAGRADALKEYTIALDVFERDESFDPQTSSIVRVEASRLRGKLEKYNAIDGRNDPIHIILPSGSYAPLFQPSEPHPTTKTRPLHPPQSGQPVIVVLPFTNMSGDPEQEYFADGLTEDLITALSHVREFFVIARNTAFTYRGRAVDIQVLANELGVRYVLEGSVRKAGNRLRISAQLIDAITSSHIWAERYDRELVDIFEIQDEVTDNVVGAVEPRLRKAETVRSKRKRPENLDAYDLYLRALPNIYLVQSDANIEALTFLEQAIALDPEHAPALATAALCYEQRIVHGWSTDLAADKNRGVELARAAVSLENDDANVLALAGFVFVTVGQDYESGIAAARRALELTNNVASFAWLIGWTYILAGDVETPLPTLERALQLSPSDPQIHFILNGLAMAHLLSGNNEEAAGLTRRSLIHYDELDVTYWVRIPALANLGLLDEAREALSKLLSLTPGLTLSGFRRKPLFKRDEHLQIIIDGLRAAGLPED